jgi:anti-anti-sigma regulatory factor
MATIPEWFKVDGEHVVQSLREADESFDRAPGRMVLDFSSVRRVDPGALRALEELAGRADDRAVKVGLRGVNVLVYKVLKLARLAPRFTFATEDSQSLAREEKSRHAER